MNCMTAYVKPGTRFIHVDPASCCNWVYLILYMYQRFSCLFVFINLSICVLIFINSSLNTALSLVHMLTLHYKGRIYILNLLTYKYCKPQYKHIVMAQL